MKFIQFEPNKPEVLVFGLSEPLRGPDKQGLLVLTQCGRAFRVAGSLAPMFQALKLRPGESFGICRYEKAEYGNVPQWEVWLTQETQEVRSGGKLLRTGTDGAGRLVAMPRRALGVVRRGFGPIPANVAFREILAFVRAAGPDWKETEVQRAVATILKASTESGWIAPWERGAA